MSRCGGKSDRDVRPGLSAARGRFTTVGLLAALVVVGMSSGARAYDVSLGPFQIDDADPAKSVPALPERNKHPMEFGMYLQELLARAADATKAGDHAKAARFYRAVTLVVPDRAVGFTRLCESLRAAGDEAGAVDACRDALARPGATERDYSTFVDLVLAPRHQLTATDQADVDAIVAHLRAEGGPASARVLAQQLACQLALHLHDVGRLERCTTQLERLAPNDGRTITLKWSLAMEHGDRAEAARQLTRARAAGVAEKSLARLSRATTTTHAGDGWSISTARGQMALAVLLLLLAAAAGPAIRYLRAHRRATPR